MQMHCLLVFLVVHLLLCQVDNRADQCCKAPGLLQGYTGLCRR